MASLTDLFKKVQEKTNTLNQAQATTTTPITTLNSNQIQPTPTADKTYSTNVLTNNIATSAKTLANQLGQQLGLTNLKDYNMNFTNSDYYRNLQNMYSEASAGAKPIDLTDIIASYNANNQATIDTLNKALENNINTLNSSSERSRNDLLTSLKRFQEANAESMKTQQQDFNASRASLEDQSFMNQRNTVANASARGLGGSGLQQLAQLQNRMAAGKDINTLAQKNQTAQNALRRALTQQQEDYDTKVAKLEDELKEAITGAQDKTALAVNQANTNNTNLINQLIYNEEARQRSYAAQAASAKTGMTNLINSMKEGVTRLQGAQTALDNALESAQSSYLASKGKMLTSQLSKKQKAELSSNLSSIYDQYMTAVSDGDIAATYGLDSSYTDTAISNLKNIYSKYKIS